LDQIWGFGSLKRAKRQKEGAFFMEAFACEERSFWSLEMGFDA
jgi:hypothetical protein